jgi:hypothetical protein
MVTVLPTSPTARKLLVTQTLTRRHPEWSWLERISAICKAHARLDAGVSVGKVLAFERPDHHRRLDV